MPTAYRKPPAAPTRKGVGPDQPPVVPVKPKPPGGAAPPGKGKRAASPSVAKAATAPAVVKSVAAATPVKLKTTPAPAGSATARPAAPPPPSPQPEIAPPQTRAYQPGDIACRHQNQDLTNCGAEPEEPCVWQQAGEEGTFHAERIEDAAAISRGAGEPASKQDFNQAVLDTGLF